MIEYGRTIEEVHIFMQWWQILLIVVAIAAAVIIVLFIMGKRAQKKHLFIRFFLYGGMCIVTEERIMNSM